MSGAIRMRNWKLELSFHPHVSCDIPAADPGALCQNLQFLVSNLSTLSTRLDFDPAPGGADSCLIGFVLPNAIATSEACSEVFASHPWCK